jgi:long-chain acyl-CoA synthetase
MNYPTLPALFLKAVAEHPNPRAQLHRKDGAWLPVSSQELLRRVAGLSSALVELGVKPGDRVGLFAPNRPEWHVADFAIFGAGAVTVPVYFKESSERMAYILNHSGAKVVFAAGKEQAARLLAIRSDLKQAEHIIIADGGESLPAECLRYETLIASAGDAGISAYSQRAASILPGQLATIIYTSGTTGEPKGVMLSHSNLVSNAVDSCATFDFVPGQDVALSFLPLAHVYGRMLDCTYLFNGVSIAYVEQPEDVPQALLEVRPTVLAAVPRFFEKIYARLMEQGAKTRGFKRRVFDWSMDVARRAAPWKALGRSASLLLRLEWWLADKLVYRKIRAGTGGRLRLVFSGGAPLAKELAEFFWVIGIPIYQGYGLTETSPIVSSNYPVNRVGSVGRPIPNVEVKIAADGEVLVKGPCVMQGYYQKSDATREVLTEDGWLRTGDIGRLDSDGYLYITDRKKDLLKTAGGKFVAPQPIENLLKTSPYILNAAVLGDRRKFVVALIVPHFANVANKARERGLWFESNAKLAADPWVHRLIGSEIQRLTSHLAQYETIKRFAVLDEDFTFDNGSLTYTMKLKRRVVEERYRDVIEQLYADVAEPRPVLDA